MVFPGRLIGGLLLIDEIGKMAEWLIHTLAYIHGGPLMFTGVYHFMHELTITLGSRGNTTVSSSGHAHCSHYRRENIPTRPVFETLSAGVSLIHA